MNAKENQIKKPKSITANELASAQAQAFDFNRLRKAMYPEPPRLAVTAVELASHEGLSVSGAKDRLRLLVDKDLLDSGIFKDKGGRMTRYYWFRETIPKGRMSALLAGLK